jgi:hypothetical protein
VLDATFAPPDLTTFCRLEELGLGVPGQRLRSDRAVLACKSGASASAFPAVDIADPHAVPFPGFDRLLISYAELMALVEDSRYASRRTALGSAQGVYLIADSSTGLPYVGKADGESASSDVGTPTPATATAATWR